jgi:hypothetical protein
MANLFFYSVLHVVLKNMLIFDTDDLLEEPNERDHDDGGEDAEWEGLEEGPQVQHHRQQHQGRHQASQQRPDQCTVLIIYSSKGSVFQGWVAGLLRPRPFLEQIEHSSK